MSEIWFRRVWKGQAWFMPHSSGETRWVIFKYDWRHSRDVRSECWSFWLEPLLVMLMLQWRSHKFQSGLAVTKHVFPVLAPCESVKDKCMIQLVHAEVWICTRQFVPSHRCWDSKPIEIISNLRFEFPSSSDISSKRMFKPIFCNEGDHSVYGPHKGVQGDCGDR